jgi:hypothetical protein
MFAAADGCDDCGLGIDAATTVSAAEQIPSLEELEAALRAALAEPSPAGPDATELDLASLEPQLSAEEELAFAAFESTDVPTLESVVAIAERYPGLKITFSF